MVIINNNYNFFVIIIMGVFMKERKVNTIEIVINDNEDFYNQFNSNKLSQDLGAYIYSQSLGYPVKDTLKISIKTKDKLSNEKKDNIVDMIREYFGLSIRETLIYYKYNKVKKILLFTLGVILICISHFIGVINDFLVSEVFLIIGWVAIWEVFENILLVETQKKFKLDRCRKLVKCKIVFED